MVEKLNLAILFGGQSGEHEVSLMSATAVINNIDKDKYSIYMIGISKDGKWSLYEGDIENIENGSWESVAKPIVFPADPSFGGFYLLSNPEKIYKVDVVFPVMHGPKAEDGTIQGLFELAKIPYVGSNVVASSSGMDKVISKAIFKSYNLPQCEYKAFLKSDYIEDMDTILNDIESGFNYPVFVKPANLGSSVGISKCYDREELIAGIDEALIYDRKVLVEEFIDGLEIECAILGHNNPEASILGEIIPCNDFYDYEAKYLTGGQSEIVIPAPLPKEKSDTIRSIAIEAYRALDCSGLARVDFFIEKATGNIYLNEVNTIPGFTQISMYSKLWEASGVSYTDLLDRLIMLALERFEEIYG
ncbi:MAG: D-alanine--D-alanine ligase [Clostridiales bacterium]|nr:D-alanine--D-alanine ligase [Clostridiales bacterium]